MEDYGDLVVRCATMVAALDRELGWQIDADERRAYSHTLAQLLPARCPDAQLRNVALCYHLDHRLVEALADRRHAGHDDGWLSWMAQVVPILRHAGLSWSNDAALSLDDLAQIARTELARALPSFRYGSRFSTWAHQVIAHSVRAALRDSQAQKRAGRPGPLDQPAVLDVAIDQDDQPETIAQGHLLAAQIDAILAAQPDKRLAEIFRLWAYGDLRVEEIGRRVRLSQSQVRLLLSRIREILQHDPSISAWRNNTGGPIADDRSADA
ncbi:MAG: sigma-70 family RNA polymerase sigma factor [Kouleothrix sp.]|nr:sigma-70 family RNA polymerase sigma factor [Kouleothrix sp.]